MLHRALGLYRSWPPRHSSGGPKRLSPMEWPPGGTDQAEGPSSTQIDHRRLPRVAEGHLERPLHDPRIRTATMTAKSPGYLTYLGKQGN